MSTDAEGNHRAVGDAPRCVVHLLATFDSMIAALSNDRPNGPYALNAVLEDVVFCPALSVAPSLPSDRHEQLVDAVEQARSAVQVVRKCPTGDRRWAVERLQVAMVQARAQLAARLEEAEANSDRGNLFGARCSTCVFASN